MAAFWSGLSLLVAAVTPSSRASDTYVYVIKKEEEKKQRRWSLEEWMTSKNRSGLMEEWLAYKSSIHRFEGMLGGDFGTYDFIDGGPYSYNGSYPIIGKHRLSEGHVALYFSIFGVDLKYEKSDEKYNALSAGLALRLLGTSLQGTHLTFQAGIRNLHEDVTYNNPYVGGFATIYLLKFFGLETLYRYFIVANATETHDKREARLYELTAFLEISFIRFYGTYYDEVSTYESGNLTYKKNRKGPLVGVKLYF